jgi:hypothetical protein
VIDYMMNCTGLVYACAVHAIHSSKMVQEGMHKRVEWSGTDTTPIQ